MRSPFPGMDPYLETRWGDFHSRLITYIADALQPALPDDLRARMGERVYVQTLEGEARLVVPDVHVHETARAQRITTGANSPGAAVAEHILVPSDVEMTERFVEIIDVRSGGRVVTVIEVLSPTNKRAGEGRNEYQLKQGDCLRAGINLVEIELLRGGNHVTLVNLKRVDRLRVTPYHVSIRRPRRSAKTEYYPIPLRDRLPRLPIPLRDSDPDAVLDLQAVADLAYERGRYDDIDYSVLLHPPFDPSDAQWVAERIASR